MGWFPPTHFPHLELNHKDLYQEGEYEFIKGARADGLTPEENEVFQAYTEVLTLLNEGKSSGFHRFLASVRHLSESGSNQAQVNNEDKDEEETEEDKEKKVFKNVHSNN